MALTRSQMNALLKRLEKPVRDAFAIAVLNAKTRAQVNRLIAAIETGDIDAIMLAAGIRDGMYSPFTESIRSAYLESGIFILAADVPKRFAVEFDINNPRAESWLRNNSSQLITGHLMPEQRAAIQVMLQDGMIKGKNPRTTALDIVGRIGPTGRRTGGVIGLTEQQAQYVVNMRNVLTNPEGVGIRHFKTDPITGKRTAVRAFWIDQNGELQSSYKLRDRRFDSMIKRAIKEGKPVPKKTLEKAIARYEDRMLKHRGDTIGRTEVLQSLNEASDEAMRQVVDEGLAPRQAITKIWRHSFGANEREGHLMMNGQRRKLDEYFVNPITGVPLPYPGNGPASEIINCRCWIEHEIDFVAVELAA